MPFNLSSGASNLMSFGKDSEKSLLNSSLYTALLMTTIIILIILTMYPCSRKATSWSKIKTFMYIFGSVFFILVLHKGTITRVLDNKHNITSSDRLLDGMGSGNVISDSVQVHPKTFNPVAELDQFTV